MRIGIDLGGTKIEGIVMGPDRGIVERLRRPTPVSEGYDAILSGLVQLVRDLEGRGGPYPVGIGTPGSVSRVTGGMKNSNTVSLNGRPLAGDLALRLEREIRIANDADCFTLSESLDGAAQGSRVVFGVILGTGVGGGVVVDGRIHVGPNGVTGEWGHNLLEPDGPECYCGRRGCVETLLSGPGLAADYRRTAGAPDPALEAPEIVTLAGTGDALARAALERYVDRLGRGLATVVNVLDPDAIVLGGGLSAIDVLYREVPVALARHVFNDELRTPILRNRHGDSSGVRGAAMLWAG